MRIRDIILLEAQPSGLGQGMLDKLFATYSRRDINDNLLGQKFEDGMQIAEYLFKFVGPKNLPWVAKQYTSDVHFFLHDLDDWKKTLIEFDSISKKRNVSIEKDINRYVNIDQVRSGIDAYKISSDEQYKQRANAYFVAAVEKINEMCKYGQARMTRSGTDYVIYEPYDYEASSIMYYLFNKQINVCTIYSEEHFNLYYNDGILMYIIPSNEYKLYNCYISADSSKRKSEFADDKNDHEFTLDWMLERFPDLKSLVKKACTSNTELTVKLSLYDTAAEKKQLCLDAVKQDGEALREVPEELRDYDICIAAVKQKSSALGIISPEFPGYKEICLVAVKHGGYALKNIPEELRDYDICLAAVKHSSFALGYVPRENLTETEYKEICLADVQKNGFALSYVPPELRDYDICLAAVKNDRDYLSYVPVDLKPKIEAALNGNDELNRVKELAERLGR